MWRKVRQRENAREIYAGRRMQILNEVKDRGKFSMGKTYMCYTCFVVFRIGIKW